MSKDKWSALSAEERAQLINIYVQSGITDLDFIKKDYNSFDEGGTIEEYDVPFPKDDDINVPYRSVITDSMKKDFITKSKNKFDTFVNKMYPIVERSLLDAGHSTDNLDNVLRQMAQESNYGLSPRGNGYNLSGIKAWDSKEGTKHKDGYYYRNFKDYRDYADYHVALLNNRYNALDAKDTKDFVYKLHHTKDGKKYSGDERGYRRNLGRMTSLDNAIKKYKENQYANGGRILDGSTEENQILSNETPENSFIERLAYNIGSIPDVKDRGRATLGNIITGISNTISGRTPYKYDDLTAFLSSPEEVGYELSEETKGPQFTKATKGKDVKTYKGIINPYNEYVVTQDNYDKFLEMAETGELFYSNADMEALNNISRNGKEVSYLNTGYRDDVQNYPIQFKVEDGQLYANAADLYDFSSTIQGKLLSKHGNPYIRRQNKIPVRAIDIPEEFITMPYTNNIEGNNDFSLTEDMKRARNMALIVKKREEEEEKRRKIEKFKNIFQNIWKFEK